MELLISQGWKMGVEILRTILMHCFGV